MCFLKIWLLLIDIMVSIIHFLSPQPLCLSSSCITYHAACSCHLFCKWVCYHYHVCIESKNPFFFIPPPLDFVKQSAMISFNLNLWYILQTYTFNFLIQAKNCENGGNVVHIIQGTFFWTSFSSPGDRWFCVCIPAWMWHRSASG